MATDLTRDELRGLPGIQAPARPEPKPRGPHRGRFLALYGLLGCALAAAVLGVVVFAGEAIHPGPQWAGWAPSGTASDMTHQIAQQIGGEYRQPNGSQLLDVYPKPLTVPFSSGSTTQNVPIAAVAIQGTGGAADKISLVSDSDTRLYQLCGSGSQCAIGSGPASIQRGRLVRREGLELALYTFKYVPGVSHVIEFMPPPPGSQPSLAMYFEKSDFQAQLGRPLARTLSPKTPLANTITAHEAATIDSLTTSRVFKYSIQPTQLGQAVIFLSTKL